jgi:IclR family KDG regulon transcriptional repressor
MCPIKEETFYNRSLERALQILMVFSNDRRVLSRAQLSEILKLPRPTVLRLCSTLVKYGFLSQDLQTRQYSLGIKLFELGGIVFSSFSIRKMAAPYLSKLQRKLGRTTSLAALENDEVLSIDRYVDPKDPIRLPSEFGMRTPPNWGALGAVLMAYLPDAEIERILQKNPLKAYTKRSFTEKEEYIKWLDQIREQGFCIEIDAAWEGITGIAAPIRDFAGKVVAGISVICISASEDSKGRKRLVKEVVGAALMISKAMGYAEGEENI